MEGVFRGFLFFNGGYREQSGQFFELITASIANGIEISGEDIDKFQFEAGIVADLTLCKEYGWTVNELREQPVYHILYARMLMAAQKEGRRKRQSNMASKFKGKR